MKALVFYALIVALVASVAVQAQAPAGGEFRVNNATSGLQTFPSVAVDPGGGFVIVWVETNSPPNVINGQRFDAQGTRRGAEFRANVTTTANAFRPVIAAGPKGRFVVAWHAAVPVTGAPVGLFGRWFDASAVPQNTQFRINSATTGNLPSVAVAAGGGFVAAWEAYGTDGSVAAAMARRFDSAGNALGSEFVVNSYTTGAQIQVTVASAASGSFVVVWSSDFQDGSGQGVFGQRFDATGLRSGAEFRVNTYTTGLQNAAQVASDAQGNFVVAWRSTPPGGPRSIVGQRFDAGGSPAGAEFVVNTFSNAFVYYLSVTSERTGNFTVAWEADGLDGDGGGIFGQRYTAAGVPRGTVFRINSSTTQEQALPKIATDAAGNLVATWISAHLPPQTSYDVFGQRFGGLFPSAMQVVDGGNNVLEVPDDFTLVTSWRNLSGTGQTFQGRASNLVVPAGLILTLSPDANYGTVADGAVGSCSAPCFAGGLLGTRPTGHVDLGFDESILPDIQGQSKRWRVHVGDSFGDVPRTNTFYRFVETLLHHGVASGCAANTYCPADFATREQMAVFVLAAKEGQGYAPPACGTPVFNDVPASSAFCRWIEELSRRGVVSGCGGGNYCPLAGVTRDQMGVFIGVTFGLTLYGP